jgi:hypothetical protein
MPKQIYELVWTIRCAVGGEELEFLRTEWKVFESEPTARAYGLHVQDELNDGLPIEEKADDGYYFRFAYEEPVEEIDGYRISLDKRHSRKPQTGAKRQQRKT